MRLTPADLGRVRFAARPHPVGAAVLASQAVRGGAAPGPLRHLLPARGMLPDFVTPYEGIESVAAGLDAIRATPRRRVRADVARAYAHLPATLWRRRLAAGDRDAVELLTSALEAWFERALRPQWSNLVLQHRRWVDRAAREWALSGVDGVLGGLHPVVRWTSPVLRLESWWNADLNGTGEGLLLAPSPFAGPRPRLLVEPGRPALLVFPVAAAGGSPGSPVVAPRAASSPDPPATPPGSPVVMPRAARAPGSPATPPGSPVVASSPGSRATPAGAGAGDALARLLGRTRAAVLRRLGEPGRHTTTALAKAAGISLPSASEHAAALRDAGLLDSEREGGAVVHRLTALGVELLGGGG